MISSSNRACKTRARARGRRGQAPSARDQDVEDHVTPPRGTRPLGETLCSDSPREIPAGMRRFGVRSELGLVFEVELSSPKGRPRPGDSHY